MKILYIIPYVPYPLNSGGNQAFFNMVDAARKEHQVSLLLYIHGSNDRESAKQLKAVWQDVDIICYKKKSQVNNVTVEIPSNVKRQCMFFEYIRNSMDRKIARRMRPYNAPTLPLQSQSDCEEQGFTLGGFVRENSTLFRNTEDLTPDFLQFVYTKSRQGYDMVQVEFFEYLPLVYVLPDNVETVFVHHEIRFVRNENEFSLFNKQTVSDRMLLERKKDAELSMLRRFKHIIVLTEVDKTILDNYLPDTDIYVSPAVTDAAKHLQSAMTFSMAHDLVFIGSGDHFPNADGLLWFGKEVMPILKQKNINIKVYAVGKWGKNIVHVVNEVCPDILFEGFVDNLSAFLNGKISIVPIRIGSGMRMKILDTIAASAPMVTTSKGCEGLPFENAEDCFIADSPEGFASAIIRLDSDESLQRMMVEKSTAKLKQFLDADKLLQRRQNFYRKLQNK